MTAPTKRPADAILEALDSQPGPLSVSSEPDADGVSIPGRVEKIRGGLDLRDGSCNPPWSAWDS